MQTPMASVKETVGRAPPSRRASHGASAAMASQAMENRAAADENGGRSSRPVRMTIQVLPQIRHRSAIKALITAGRGALLGAVLFTRAL